MSMSRIWAIAINGFREGIRARALYLIAFFALLFALALQILPDVSATYEDKILLDIGLGMMGLLTAIAAIALGAKTIDQEIERRTILVLVAKPLSRTELIVGKHLGLVAVAWVWLVTMTAIYLIGLSLVDISYSFGAIALSALYLLLELGLLIAAALTFSVFTSSLLATLLTFGLYLVGHFSRDLLELGQLSENSTIERFTQVLYVILPDLSRLNLRNDVVYGVIPSGGEIGLDVFYGLAYIMALLILAAAVLSHRQF
ncbi:MAG: ABC transporter permease [Spirulinaceae cyanobacterium]